MKKSLLTRRVAVLAAASSVFLAACGGGGSSDTTDGPDNSSVCANTDKKVLSLSPTATEMVYAIGAGDQVVAVDSLSNFPAEAAAKVTKISAFEPNAEEVLGYDPDIVLISNDMNSITAQLQSVKPEIEVWTGAAPSAIGDVYMQIDALGALLCRETEAATVIDTMETEINAALSGAVAPEGASYFYELDDTLYSVTSATFVGSLLASTGITNIADGVEEGNNYPQMNAESIISANPSIIFLADVKCCGQNEAEVAKRPGWSAIDAVKNGRVVEIDDDVASRWGPRIVELVQIMASAVRDLGS